MGKAFEQLAGGHLLRRLCEQEFGGIMAEYDLRLIDIDVLYFLSDSGDRDTARDIVRQNWVSKANVSKSVEHLRRLGLLEEDYDAGDRRRIHLTVTPRGAVLVEEICAVRARINGILYDGVSPEEQMLLRQLAEKISGNIVREIEASKVSKRIG